MIAIFDYRYINIDYIAFSSSLAFFPEHKKYFSVQADGTRKMGKVPSGIGMPLLLRRKIAQKRIADTWGEEFAKRHYSMQLDYINDMGFMDKGIL